MGSIDDFPAQNPADPIQDAAEAEFEKAVRNVKLFGVQKPDRHDYGSDYQLEVRERFQTTNFRVHVQLKGNTAQANSDGSVSVEVARSNLNYLLAVGRILPAWHRPIDLRLAF
jgi:hypothetical protein